MADRKTDTHPPGKEPSKPASARRGVPTLDFATTLGPEAGSVRPVMDDSNTAAAQAGKPVSDIASKLASKQNRTSAKTDDPEVAYLSRFAGKSKPPPELDLRPVNVRFPAYAIKAADMHATRHGLKKQDVFARALLGVEPLDTDLVEAALQLAKDGQL